MKTRKTCKYFAACATSYSCHKCGGYVNAKREQCAAAGRALRQLQQEHLKSVMREMRGALEMAYKSMGEQGYSAMPINTYGGKMYLKIKMALEAGRRLGL